MALETAAYGRTTYSQADLEQEWSELDLAQDTRVLRDGDRVVAYGIVSERDAAWRVEGYVDPSARGRGIGTQLAAELEHEAVRGGAERVRNNTLEADAGARVLLESLGYRMIRVFREMRIDLHAAPA